MNIPRDLKRLYKDRRLILFVGAGVSMSVNWEENGSRKRGPSWAELVNEAADQLGFSDPELARVRGSDLQILEYFRHKSAAGFLTTWLIGNMQAPPDALKRSRLHQAIVSLDNIELFYTTNFDDFLERSFNYAGRSARVVATEKDMGVVHEEACEIIKFHGDWNHPDSMVLSESDYERRLRLETAMDFRLRADLLGRGVLFIGYSFRDANVAYLFRLIQEQFASLPNTISGKRAYIAVPEPSDFESTLFAARNIEVLGVSSLKTTNDVVGLLTELKS